MVLVEIDAEKMNWKIASSVSLGICPIWVAQLLGKSWRPSSETVYVCVPLCAFAFPRARGVFCNIDWGALEVCATRSPVSKRRETLSPREQQQPIWQTNNHRAACTRMMNPSRVEKGPPPCYGISRPAQLETASNSRLATNLLCENSPPLLYSFFYFSRNIIYSAPMHSRVNYHIKSEGGSSCRLCVCALVLSFNSRDSAGVVAFFFVPAAPAGSLCPN